MPQAFDKFPKTGVGTNQEEQIWRHYDMFNIHINAHKMRWLKDMTDIMDCHSFEDDFCCTPCTIEGQDTCGRWTLNQVGAGTLTGTDAVNGIMSYASANTANTDYGELTQAWECWRLDACYPLYTEIRFQISNFDSRFWFGLIQGNSWFGGIAGDYVVFKNDIADAFLDFETSLVMATTPAANIMTLVADTWYRLGIHWDGDGMIRWFVIQDGNFPQTILEAGLVTATIPITELTLGFGIGAGVATAARTILVDYIKCAQKRVI